MNKNKFLLYKLARKVREMGYVSALLGMLCVALLGMPSTAHSLNLTGITTGSIYSTNGVETTSGAMTTDTNQIGYHHLYVTSGLDPSGNNSFYSAGGWGSSYFGQLLSGGAPVTVDPDGQWFTVYLDGGITSGTNQVAWGMNLFFNGQTFNPGISVRAPTDTSLADGPAFTPISSNLNTWTLARNTGQNLIYSVLGAGTIQFMDTDGSLWQLSEFNWYAPSVYNRGRVGNIDDWNDDAPIDWVIQFELTKAAPVPEPATMLLLGSGIVGLAGFRRRFKKS